MKKFVKGFQNANNKTGGLYGFKRIKVSDDISSMMSAFEDSNAVSVIKYGDCGVDIMKTGYEVLTLRKRNNDTFLSKKQIKHFNYRKKKNTYYYSNGQVFKGYQNKRINTTRNPQRFITLDY